MRFISPVKHAVSLATTENWQWVDVSYSSPYTVAPWQPLWSDGHQDVLEASPKCATAIVGHTRTYARDAAQRCPSSRVGCDFPMIAAAPQSSDGVSGILAQLVSFNGQPSVSDGGIIRYQPITASAALWRGFMAAI